MSNFVKILEVDQLEPGRVATVTVKGHDVCIANVEGEFFALGADAVAVATGGHDRDWLPAVSRLQQQQLPGRHCHTKTTNKFIILNA